MHRLGGWGGVVRGLCRAVLPWLWVGVAAAQGDLRVLATAQRTLGGVTTPVELPDRVAADAAAGAPLRAVYRWQIELPAAAPDLALYFPGLRSAGRVAVNGQTLHDNRGTALGTAPRGIDRLLLLRVPPELWRTGPNTIELDALGADAVWVSALEVGPSPLLIERQRQRAWGTVFGPALVAAVVGTLGVSVLFLWWRRREVPYLYFGLGVLGWALHTALTVSAVPLWPEPHQRVLWHGLYGFFVAMLMLFCLRFADWRWPAFERFVLASVLLAPLVLYAALAADPASRAPETWRLGVIALVAVAVLALVRVARRSPQRDKLLLATVGGAALVAALHDWRASVDGSDNNPVFWVPFVALLFAAFVMRLLIDRFLHATQSLEALNAELGQRVAAQNAELRQALAQMRDARDAAEAADLAKTRFIAAASHDLRQPVHALGLYMATLRAGPLVPAQAELAARMGGSLAALDTLFTALLDVSRLDAGAVTPRWELVPLAPLLRRLADEWAPQAEARGLRLALRVADPAAMTVTDPLLLERVLRNLLANAVKYTPRGGVLLACRERAGAAGSGQRSHRIEVWDSGIGIPEADHERVFEEFHQLGNPARDRAAGLGLGLAIVRRLARLLQLDLQLHSRPGRGSVFFVGGLAPAGRAPQQVAAARTGMRRLAGTVVAVIEDDAEVRDAMRRLLDLWECQVVDGGNAHEVLQRSRQHGTPQAVVADLRLAAGAHGPAEAQALFAAWGRPVPLLLVSGETAPATLQALQAAGHTCLAKPVSPARLRAWLEQAVQTNAPDTLETQR